MKKITHDFNPEDNSFCELLYPPFLILHLKMYIIYKHTCYSEYIHMITNTCSVRVPCQLWPNSFLLPSPTLPFLFFVSRQPAYPYLVFSSKLFYVCSTQAQNDWNGWVWVRLRHTLQAGLLCQCRGPSKWVTL